MLFKIGRHVDSQMRTGRMCVCVERRVGWSGWKRRWKLLLLLMFNELENTIELLWLWKLLRGRRKLASVWELACWQKRGFVWGSLLHRPRASEVLRAVSWPDLSQQGDQTFLLKSLVFHHLPPIILCLLYLQTSSCYKFFTLSCYLWLICGCKTTQRQSGYRRKRANTSLIFSELWRLTPRSGFAGLAHAFCY